MQVVIAYTIDSYYPLCFTTKSDELIIDELVKSRIHQVLNVKFYINDIVCFNKDLNPKS